MSNPRERDLAALAALYALGHLHGARRAAFEALIENDREAAALLAGFQRVADALAWAVPAATPPAGLRSRLLQRVRAKQEPASAPRIAPAAGQWLVFAERLPWQPTATPGIRVKILLADRQRRCAVLVAMAAGTAMPAHRHAGGEDMIMLSGDAWIDHHRLQAGDYVRSDAGTAHPPIRTDAGCTFFCLSSLDDHFVIPGREDLPVEAWAGSPPPPA